MQNNSSIQPISFDPRTGIEIVAKLLARQDVVLDDLDLLNNRIEAMIREISAGRQNKGS